MAAAARRVERLLACGGWPLPTVKSVSIHLKGEAANNKLYRQASALGFIGFLLKGLLSVLRGV